VGALRYPCVQAAYDALLTEYDVSPDVLRKNVETPCSKRWTLVDLDYARRRWAVNSAV